MKTSIVLLLLLAGCATQTPQPQPAPAATTTPPAAVAPPPKAGPPPAPAALPPAAAPQQPGEALPQATMSESVPPIAAATDTTPMPVLTTAEQELWSHFAAALASRNLTLDASATQLLRAQVHRAEDSSDQAKAAKARAIYEKLVNTPEGVRYNKPGLQSHIQYLGSLTSGVDQKIGRDAVARYQVLKKELDELKAEAAALGI